jgi:hypothetical protein
MGIGSRWPGPVPSGRPGPYPAMTPTFAGRVGDGISWVRRPEGPASQLPQACCLAASFPASQPIQTAVCGRKGHCHTRFFSVTPIHCLVYGRLSKSRRPVSTYSGVRECPHVSAVAEVRRQKQL